MTEGSGEDLARRAEALRANGGTLRLDDGVVRLRRTLVLPQGVSLCLAPGAQLVAEEGFDGEAVVETEPYAEGAWGVQCIEGGVIDGGGQPLIGIRTVRDRETDIRNITVRNCTRKGLHLGVKGCCETNCLNVRVQCERGILAAPGSIGIHYDRTTDNLCCMAIVIGYETGVRSDSSSNDFQQVHVWNYGPGDNAPLVTCFACNGWNDSWSQCYADSPINGDQPGYGFLVSRPFNRITNSRVYGNPWVTPDRVVGIQIEPGGTHGTYIGNHFTAREGHRLRAAFAGTFEAATIFGNSFNPQVRDGIVAQIPSGGGGLSPMPEVRFVKGEEEDDTGSP